MRERQTEDRATWNSVQTRLLKKVGMEKATRDNNFEGKNLSVDIEAEGEKSKGGRREEKNTTRIVTVIVD